MSFRADPLKKKANYYTIKKDDVNGLAFRLPTTADDPEAVTRPYDNPKTGESGIAHEKAFKALYGLITNVSFNEKTLKDGTTLKSMNITLGEDENGTQQIVSLPLDSRYTTDFLKRLPLIDAQKEVRLMPYDFQKDGPRQVGISVYHKNPDTDEFTEKVDNNYFTTVTEKDGQKVYTNNFGFPEVTDDDSSDWPFYFKKVNKFLVKFAQEKILPQFQNMRPKPFQSKEEEDASYPQNKLGEEPPF